jgi:uncharacterized damage-inducible protein DinB
MTIADLLLPEFDQEMATTRRVLERVPEDKFAWKPHDKSFSMGDLASHVVNSVKWTNDTMNRTEFDLASVTPETLNQAAKTRAELLAWFDANVQGEKVYFTMPRYNCVRSFVLNHIVHHRAQLTVYLRLNNVPVPGAYGPSADEM